MSEQEMLTDAQFRASIRGGVDEALASRGAVRTSWLAEYVISTHEPIGGRPDAAWWNAGLRLIVHDIVTRIVRALKNAETEAPDPQLTFAGYTHFQKRYAVQRDGEPWIVPAEQVTNDEFAQKVTEMRAMAAGLEAHCQEIEDFVTRRSQAA